MDGGTVRVFLPVWLCCGGYGTLEMVGGWSVFTALFAVSFSWRFDVCGRIFVLYSSISFGEFVVFSCGFGFESY